jgi:hypothetical protein
VPALLTALRSSTSQTTPTRVLDAEERIAEVLFGLIMVLTFTGSLSIAEAGRDDVRAMLIGALGCNIAWGVIDAILYLMGCLAERGRSLKIYRAVRESVDPADAHRLMADALPSVLASAIDPEALERARQHLVGRPEPPAYARLSADDWRGALAVFLLVFLSTLPVSVPFVFMHSAQSALRVSNGVAVVMLFAAGSAYGRVVGRTPLGFGISMVALGSVLVGLTIALGG